MSARRPLRRSTSGVAGARHGTFRQIGGIRRHERGTSRDRGPSGPVLPPGPGPSSVQPSSAMPPGLSPGRARHGRPPPAGRPRLGADRPPGPRRRRHGPRRLPRVVHRGRLDPVPHEEVEALPFVVPAPARARPRGSSGTRSPSRPGSARRPPGRWRTGPRSCPARPPSGGASPRSRCAFVHVRRGVVVRAHLPHPELVPPDLVHPVVVAPVVATATW
jgi:hypothetical protein